MSAGSRIVIPTPIDRIYHKWINSLKDIEKVGVYRRSSCHGINDIEWDTDIICHLDAINRTNPKRICSPIDKEDGDGGKSFLEPSFVIN